MADLERWREEVVAALGDPPQHEVERVRVRLAQVTQATERKAQAARRARVRRFALLGTGALAATGLLVASIDGLRDAASHASPVVHESSAPENTAKPADRVALARPGSEALGTHTEREAATTGSEVSVPNPVAPARVEYGKGARIDAAPGAHGTLLGPRRFRIDAGEFRVDLTRAEDSAWSFTVATYEVAVASAAFRISHTPASEKLDLVVESGELTLRGGLLQKDPISLTQGDALVAEGLEVSITRHRATAPERRRAVPSRAGWRQLYAEGRYREAFDQAQSQHLFERAPTLSRATLEALADAARLAGEASYARETLHTLRDRFPGTRAASTAAFLLGRLANDSRSAARWFETYEREAPRGPYLAEALGRLLAAQAAGPDTRAAQRTAKRYLERYPQGVYARLAHSLAGTAPDER